mmetsp:Transcript_58088/g.155256  ORF Transcript_58088/g.155256 Transcript_58088/m.155256 type:complete len:579 (+) Transcript_58088:34-1770(+)
MAAVNRRPEPHLGYGFPKPEVEFWQHICAVQSAPQHLRKMPVQDLAPVRKEEPQSDPCQDPPDEVAVWDGETFEITYPKQAEPAPRTRSGGNAPRRDPGQPSPADLVACHVLHSIGSDLSRTKAIKEELVQAVTKASEAALGKDFQRAVLVGSNAMHIDAPGSDIDVVVFHGASVQDVTVLKDVMDELDKPQPGLPAAEFKLVATAKVPILTIHWPAPVNIFCDVSVNKEGPENHVAWVAKCVARDPPLESAMKLLKHWLRQRRIPPAKEGGYPSLVWGILQVHTARCSVMLTWDHDRVGEVLKRVAMFFERFASQQSLSGSIIFEGDLPAGEGSSFVPAATPAGPRDVIWHKGLSLQDPTQKADGESNMGGTVSLATHYLHMYELRRGQKLLEKTAAIDENGAMLEELFAAVPEEVNKLPTEMSPGLAEEAMIILLDKQPNQPPQLRLARPKEIKPRDGWGLPWLSRKDPFTEIVVELLEVQEDHSGYKGGPNKLRVTKGKRHTIQPCHFVCMCGKLLRQPNDRYIIENEEGLRRWWDMRQHHHPSQRHHGHGHGHHHPHHHHPQHHAYHHHWNNGC